MADPRRRLPVSISFHRVLGLLIGWIILCATPVKATDMADAFGDPAHTEVTLFVPVMPTILDSKGLLVAPMRRWLAHVATDAAIHLTIQAANYDRRTADMARHPTNCVLGYARLPDRENLARWLAAVRRDRMVFIARRDDPFQGELADFLKIAGGKVAAPSGVYRSVLDARGVAYLAIDDQRALARMVDAGRVRFGMLISGTLDAPDVQSLELRVVAEMPPQEFWFACNPQMPDDVAQRLANALRSEPAEALRRVAMGEASVAPVTQ